MILAYAVLIGLVAGLCRAKIKKRPYRVYELQYSVLVFLAFVPQFFAFFLPSTRQLFSDNVVSILLISSLIILLIFSLFNIQKPSFWPISFGFFANFLVIILNGGFMPISLETVDKLLLNSTGNWIVGQRLGYSKDIILTPSLTRLYFLSDRLTLPDWINYRAAFSVGDLFIAAGVLWLLWMLGGETKQVLQESKNEQHLL